MLEAVVLVSHDKVFDLVGVGIGPFNLSLAALLNDVPELCGVFFERRPSFEWHRDLMLRNARMQTSFLKDLVTFADPTNAYSFVSFLHSQGRLHHFLNAEFGRPVRSEFAEYMTWVASRLPCLRFGEEVERVDYKEELFTTYLHSGLQVQSRNIILGTGRRPRVPQCTMRHLGATVFHASEFRSRFSALKAPRSIAVVGGGQSGAEILLHLLRECSSPAAELFWTTRRPNFFPLDESPFTNEFFMPGFTSHFFGLDAPRRQATLKSQKLASDGISQETLKELYQELYLTKFVERRGAAISLAVDRELSDLIGEPGGWRMVFEQQNDRQVIDMFAEVVILATGYEQRIPRLIEGISDLFKSEGSHLKLKPDFSAYWQTERPARLYLQNVAQHSHGIADPNLSLMAWRSATIINSIIGRERFAVGGTDGLVQWGATSSAACVGENA